MPPAHETEVLHGRISELKDELKGAIAELTAEVRASNELCRVCRPKVLGNGKEGFDTRLARIEEGQIDRGESRLIKLETSQLSNAWWIAKILASCTLLATVTSVVVSFVIFMYSRQPQ